MAGEEGVIARGLNRRLALSNRQLQGGEIDEHAGESLHWQVFVLNDR